MLLKSINSFTIKHADSEFHFNNSVTKSKLPNIKSESFLKQFLVMISSTTFI